MTVPLHTVLEALARDTWDRLRDARALGIRFGEETITDLVLLELKRLGSGQIQIVQTPKSSEKTSGTDWEWWVGSNHTGWTRFAIQAKRLSPRSGRYEGLRHKVGSSLQIDLLEKYARSNRAVPMYCFFNFVDKLGVSDVRHAWHCCEEKAEVQQLACTLTPLDVANRAARPRGCKTFAGLHSNLATLPWRCLLKCPRFKDRYEHLTRMINDVKARIGEEPWGIPWEQYARLPPTIERARGSGEIREFAEDVYRGEAGSLPRWIAVFESPHERLTPAPARE